MTEYIRKDFLIEFLERQLKSEKRIYEDMCSEASTWKWNMPDRTPVTILEGIIAYTNAIKTVELSGS